MYLCITVALKLLPDECVECVPVAVNQISPQCPQVAEHKRLTQHTVQLTALLQIHTQKSIHTFKRKQTKQTVGYLNTAISSNCRTTAHRYECAAVFGSECSELCQSRVLNQETQLATQVPTPLCIFISQRNQTFREK